MAELLVLEREEAFWRGVDNARRFFMGEANVQKALERLALVLDKNGIPYAVVGALALNEWGYQRLTVDVDILLSADMQALVESLKSFTLHIVLVEPEIHFNTGNVGRTCLATGAKLHLVRPLGFSLDDARVKRAGLDYWPAVNPVVWESFEKIEPVLPQLGTPVFFSAEASRTYWEVSYLGPTVLVFGRESTGLSATLRAKYRDSLVALPQEPGSVRSLNLSNTVAVAAYEVLRQRQ